MRTLTVVAASLGLSVGGLLAPAVAPAEPSAEVRSGTLTLSIQSGQLTLGADASTRVGIDSGQLTLRADGSGHTVESGWLTLGGTAYTVTSGTLTLSHPDDIEYRVDSGQLTLGGTAYGIQATAIEY